MRVCTTRIFSFSSRTVWCFGGGENQGNLHTLAWTKTQALAQAEDWVQDKTLAVAKRLEDSHRIRECTVAG